MSLLQSYSVIKQTLGSYALALSRLSQKNKSIAIRTAVILTLAYVIQERILKPPKRLRHLPYVNYFQFLKFVFNKQSTFDYAQKNILPIINQKDSDGVYMRPGNQGWDIMIANPDYAKQVLFKHDMFPKMDLLKGVEGTLLYKFSGGPNIFIANGHDWRAQRTVVSPAFHRSMPIRMFGELAISLFKTMDKMSETIEVTGLIRRYTLDAIGKAGFGFDFNATVDPKSKWVEIYDSINDGLQDPLFFMFPSFDHQWLWLFPKRKAIHDKLDIFLKMMDNVITTKRKDIRQGKVTNDNLEEHEKDILTLMIEAEERGEGILTDTDLKSNLCFFFLAGHDTTLNALSLAIYYLAIHPEIQQRAREEAMHILGKEPVDIAPTLEQTKEMTFINQIIKETLRIHPTAPQVVPRITQQDSVFGDKFIPKGSRVSVDIYCMHHYNKVWPDAETFNPDRFSGNEHTQHGISWLSFSSGARQCLGMNFSLAEQRVVLSMLLRKYDWSLPKDSIHKHGVLTSGLFLAGPKDLEITFKKRY